MNKITCICLGVKDMERSIKFYRDGLGYKTDCRENNPSVCFFDTPGTKFELFPLEQLAKDIDENNPPKGNGFSGITLAYNVEHKEDVETVIALVRKAGGKIENIAYLYLPIYLKSFPSEFLKFFGLSRLIPLPILLRGARLLFLFPMSTPPLFLVPC